MRIVGFMVVGPNEADRYLEASLKELKRLCDDAVIVGNNTDPKTEALIKQYGFWFYRDDREWGFKQPAIKTDLLKRIAHLQPDWIIALDSDEVFAPEFTRAEAERLTTLDEVAFYFMIVNLYNDREHFAHDVGIQRFWNVRMYKFMPEYGLEFQKKALHCGLAPPIAYQYAWHAPFYVEHYGLMTAEDRARKVERYATFDPSARYKSRAYYDDLARQVAVYDFDRQALLGQMRALPDCQKRKRPNLPQL